MAFGSGVGGGAGVDVGRVEVDVWVATGRGVWVDVRNSTVAGPLVGVAVAPGSISIAGVFVVTV